MFYSDAPHGSHISKVILVKGPWFSSLLVPVWRDLHANIIIYSCPWQTGGLALIHFQIEMSLPGRLGLINDRAEVWEHLSVLKNLSVNHRRRKWPVQNLNDPDILLVSRRITRFLDGGCRQTASLKLQSGDGHLWQRRRIKSSCTQLRAYPVCATAASARPRRLTSRRAALNAGRTPSFRAEAEENKGH